MQNRSICMVQTEKSKQDFIVSDECRNCVIDAITQYKHVLQHETETLPEFCDSLFELKTNLLSIYGKFKKNPESKSVTINLNKKEQKIILETLDFYIEYVSGVFNLYGVSENITNENQSEVVQSIQNAKSIFKQNQ